MWSIEDKEYIVSKLKNFDKKELNERISNFNIEELSSVTLNNLDVVSRLRSEYECVGCLANMSMLVKDIFTESMCTDVSALNSHVFFRNLKLNEYFLFQKMEKSSKAKEVQVVVRMHPAFLKKLTDDKLHQRSGAVHSFTAFLVESISLWDYLKFKSTDSKKAKAKARCELHANKPIGFAKWEYSWRKLPMEYPHPLKEVLKIENDKFLKRLDLYMKKRRFCNYCKRKIATIYCKMQDKMSRDEVKEDVVSCERCEKENCYCKKCSSIMNESISEFANLFAQHQNSNLSEKSIMDKEFGENHNAHAAKHNCGKDGYPTPSVNASHSTLNAHPASKPKPKGSEEEDTRENKKHEFFFDKLDNVLEGLNTEWLYSSDSESHSSEESVAVTHSFEVDSVRIINHLKYDRAKEVIEVPNNLMILKSLLARAESSQYLTNGCVNSASASRDELLIALGLEVKDAILKLLKEKASEERILLSLRATICKMFMSSIEQRSANIDIEEICNRKRRKRNRKKKKDEEKDEPLDEILDVEFNDTQHRQEKEMHQDQDQEQAEDEHSFAFDMQPVEYRILDDNDTPVFLNQDRVSKRRKENLNPEDTLTSLHNQSSNSNNAKPKKNKGSESTEPVSEQLGSERSNDKQSDLTINLESNRKERNPAKPKSAKQPHKIDILASTTKSNQSTALSTNQSADSLDNTNNLNTNVNKTSSLVELQVPNVSNNTPNANGANQVNGANQAKSDLRSLRMYNGVGMPMPFFKPSNTLMRYYNWKMGNEKPGEPYDLDYLVEEEEFYRNHRDTVGAKMKEEANDWISMKLEEYISTHSTPADAHPADEGTSTTQDAQAKPLGSREFDLHSHTNIQNLYSQMYATQHQTSHSHTSNQEDAKQGTHPLGSEDKQGVEEAQASQANLLNLHKLKHKMYHNSNYMQTFQRILKNPQSKDQMLLKLLQKSPYATSQALSEKTIENKRNTEFLREFKKTRNVALAKQASRKLEMDLRQNLQEPIPDVEPEQEGGSASTPLDLYKIPHSQQKTFYSSYPPQYKGSKNGNMILEYIIHNSPQLGAKGKRVQAQHVNSNHNLDEASLGDCEEYEDIYEDVDSQEEEEWEGYYDGTADLSYAKNNYLLDPLSDQRNWDLLESYKVEYDFEFYRKNFDNIQYLRKIARLYIRWQYDEFMKNYYNDDIK